MCEKLSCRKLVLINIFLLFYSNLEQIEELISPNSLLIISLYLRGVKTRVRDGSSVGWTYYNYEYKLSILITAFITFPGPFITFLGPMHSLVGTVRPTILSDSFCFLRIRTDEFFGG